MATSKKKTTQKPAARLAAKKPVKKKKTTRVLTPKKAAPKKKTTKKPAVSKPRAKKTPAKQPVVSSKSSRAPRSNQSATSTNPIHYPSLLLVWGGIIVLFAGIMLVVPDPEPEFCGCSLQQEVQGAQSIAVVTGAVVTYDSERGTTYGPVYSDTVVTPVAHQSLEAEVPDGYTGDLTINIYSSSNTVTPIVSQKTTAQQLAAPDNLLTWANDYLTVGTYIVEIEIPQYHNIAISDVTFPMAPELSAAASAPDVIQSYQTLVN